MANKLFLIAFILLSKTSHAEKLPTSIAEERLKAMVELYNYSAKLYSTQGPRSFWKNFAYLASEDELKSLVKITRGYPTLPTIKQNAANSITIHYEDKLLAEVKVINFEKQLISVNEKMISIPMGASIEETSKLFQIEVFSQVKSKPSVEKIIEELLGLKSAYAGGKKSTSTPHNGFLSKIFGSFSNGYWGRRSKPTQPYRQGQQLTHAAGISNEAPASTNNNPPEPIPSPSPETANTGTSTTKYYDTKATPSSDLVKTLSIPPLDLKNSACTIVFTRHGEKDRKRNTQPLTENGWKQAQALSQSMQDFEAKNGTFDWVLHSSELRSIQTASPLVNHIKGDSSRKTVIAPDNIQTLLRECSPYNKDTCEAQAIKAFAVIKDYCKSKKGAKIFITSHGSLGSHLMHLLRGTQSPVSGPDCARPYVFTSGDGAKFDKVYQSEGADLCKG